MDTINACLVVSSGMAGAGNTTICKELARQIANAVYLDRDDVLWGLMYVAPGDVPSLLPFEEYVKNDGILPDHVRNISTFSGPMVKIVQRSGFYHRHVKNQSYLLLERLAKQHLALGKVAIIDSFLMRQVNNGTLRAFLEQEYFHPYPKRVLHFAASANACYARHRKRSETYSEEEALLRQELSASRNSFDEEVRLKYHESPVGLKNISHLVVNTDGRSVQESVSECLAYIAG